MKFSCLWLPSWYSVIVAVDRCSFPSPFKGSSSVSFPLLMLCGLCVNLNTLNSRWLSSLKDIPSCCVASGWYVDPEGSSLGKINLWPNTVACSVKQFIAFFNRHEVSRCPRLLKYELLCLEPGKPPCLTCMDVHTTVEEGYVKVCCGTGCFKLTPAFSLGFPTRLMMCCSGNDCTHLLCQKHRVLLKVLSFAAWLCVTWKLYSHVHLNILRPK